MIDELKTRIAALRSRALPLEPDGADRAELGQQALDHVLAYQLAIAEAPSFRPHAEAFSRRLEPEFADGARDPTAILAYVAQCIDAPGMATTSPRFMGYIPGGALFHAALADLLAASSNKYSGFASASPGAVRIENALTDWLCSVIGLPSGAGGTLTSGGSGANLTAIIAARDAIDPQGGGAVYLTDQAHYCIGKALHIAGRGTAPKRLIATDAHQRMDPGALTAALDADRAARIRPWLVIGSAGTIDTGAVDPLPALATLARKHGAWFHVDGAYGGLFALCDEGKARLAGIDLADSVALDPHKTLFLPYGTGAALVRQRQHLFDSFAASADYIQPLGEFDVGPSPADMSIELTRHFRALRMWLPLQLAGLDAFRAAQEEKLALAQYFYTQMQMIERFEVLGRPDLSVVTFRHVPPTGDADQFNERLLRHLIEEGRVLLSGTRVNGKAMLRCAIGSFRTHLEHVDEVLDALQRGVKAVANGG